MGTGVPIGTIANHGRSGAAVTASAVASPQATSAGGVRLAATVSRSTRRVDS